MLQDGSLVSENLHGEYYTLFRVRLVPHRHRRTPVKVSRGGAVALADRPSDTECELARLELFGPRVRFQLAAVTVMMVAIFKVPELSRRTLSEKVVALLDARGIVTYDLPEDWLKSVISLRNQIVRTGVTHEFHPQEPDTLNRTTWVREIVTRIILERIGFVGAYRSWLHHGTQLHFPDCVPMDEWVRLNPPTA